MVATPSPAFELLPSHQLASAQRRAILALCEVVFAEDFSALFALLPESAHVLVWADRALVAHACWVERWLRPEGLPLLRTAYVEAGPWSSRSASGAAGAPWRRDASARRSAGMIGGLATAAPVLCAAWLEQWRGPTAIRMADGLLPTPIAIRN